MNRPLSTCFFFFYRYPSLIAKTSALSRIWLSFIILKSAANSVKTQVSNLTTIHHSKKKKKSKERKKQPSFIFNFRNPFEGGKQDFLSFGSFLDVWWVTSPQFLLAPTKLHPSNSTESTQITFIIGI